MDLKIILKKRELYVNFQIVLLFVLLNIWYRHYVHYVFFWILIILFSTLCFFYVLSLIRYLIKNKNSVNGYKKKLYSLIFGLFTNLGFIAMALYYCISQA